MLNLGEARRILVTVGMPALGKFFRGSIGVHGQKGARSSKGGVDRNSAGIGLTSRVRAKIGAAGVRMEGGVPMGGGDRRVLVAESARIRSIHREHSRLDRHRRSERDRTCAPGTAIRSTRSACNCPGARIRCELRMWHWLGASGGQLQETPIEGRPQGLSSGPEVRGLSQGSTLWMQPTHHF